jgi:hypothetical protein
VLPSPGRKWQAGCFANARGTSDRGCCAGVAGSLSHCGGTREPGCKRQEAEPTPSAPATPPRLCHLTDQNICAIVSPTTELKREKARWRISKCTPVPTWQIPHPHQHRRWPRPRLSLPMPLLNLRFFSRRDRDRESTASPSPSHIDILFMSSSTRVTSQRTLPQPYTFCRTPPTPSAYPSPTPPGPFCVARFPPLPDDTAPAICYTLLRFVSL